MEFTVVEVVAVVAAELGPLRSAKDPLVELEGVEEEVAGSHQLVVAAAVELEVASLSRLHTIL